MPLTSLVPKNVHGPLRMRWMAPTPTGVEMREYADVIVCKERSHPMQVATVGLDLAKDIFQVHRITNRGDVVFNRAIKRKDLLAFFDRLPPCLVGMEACGSAHH